jgi:hypothetical protein
MSEKCKICQSGRAGEIDALLASGLSLTKVSGKTGFGRLVVWRHSKHAQESEPADATSNVRRLLKENRQLYQKATRARAWDVAARLLAAITDLELRLATPAPRPDKKHFDDENQPWCKLVWSTPTGNRHLTEDEFLNYVLQRQG